MLKETHVSLDDLMYWGLYRDYILILDLTEVEIRQYLQSPGSFAPTVEQVERAKRRLPWVEELHQTSMESLLRYAFSAEGIQRKAEFAREQIERHERLAMESRELHRKAGYLPYFVRWISDGEIRNEKLKDWWRAHPGPRPQKGRA